VLVLDLAIASKAMRLMTGFSTTVTISRPPDWLMRISLKSPVANSAL